MTKAEMYKRIKDKTGVKTEDVGLVIKAMENLVYEVIATDDSLKFSFGTIGGKDKPPHKISGQQQCYSGNWSHAKTGVPYIKWNDSVTVCEIIPPLDWFNKFGYPDDFTEYIGPIQDWETFHTVKTLRGLQQKDNIIRNHNDSRRLKKAIREKFTATSEDNQKLQQKMDAELQKTINIRQDYYEYLKERKIKNAEIVKKNILADINDGVDKILEGTPEDKENNKEKITSEKEDENINKKIEKIPYGYYDGEEEIAASNIKED